jgi:RNA polymerase sigma-70 factor (ECF subfamily)
MVQGRGDPDREKAAALINKYSPDVYRLALYLLRSEEEARDAAADVFLKIYARPEILPREVTRSWLMKVTNNHCHDVLRKKSLFKRLLPKIYARVTAGPGPTPEQAVLEADEQSGVRQAVARLPDQDRAIIFLRYYQQLSYEEIGAILDMPGATVGTRLHRARERLKKELAGPGGGDL